MSLRSGVWDGPSLRCARVVTATPEHQSRSRSEMQSIKPSHPCFVGIMKQTELTIGPWQQLPESLMAARERLTLLFCLSLK